MKVTLAYGTNEVTLNEVKTGTTVGTLKNDPNIQAVLCFGKTVTAKSNGLQLSDETVVVDNSKLVFETAAQSKA
jgi:hypothetical protein